eukprot:TRINITY_DN1638_c0_g1_i1.p1 TRINITY_DN1638_c0_g1~~TRINITY_DN1638_c0_g1_i1.p1  ORF type:complete len:840 (+),score=182.44 TRINITY_DN1638_c0_g1_i1:279-2522(+)
MSSSLLADVDELGSNAYVVRSDDSGYPVYLALLTYSEAEEFRSDSKCDIQPVTSFGKVASAMFEASGAVNSQNLFIKSAENDSVVEKVSTLYVKLGQEYIKDAVQYGESWLVELGQVAQVNWFQNYLFWMHISSSDNETYAAIISKQEEWKAVLAEIASVIPKCDFSKIQLEAVSSGFAMSSISDALYQLTDDVEFNAAMLWISLYISAQHEVLFVQDIPRVRKLNKNAVWIVQSGVQDSTPIFSAGLKGDDQIVSIADTGLDQYSCFFYDSTNGITPTSDYSDPQTYTQYRKVIQYINFADSTDYEGGHGTHVSGTIVGNTNNNSASAYNGLAPNAKIAFFDIAQGSSESLSIPSDLKNILLPPGYKAGARVHSASWGGTSNSYTSLDEDFDGFMYENPDFLIVVAAGNCGESDSSCTTSGFYSVGTPAIAKNVISVGASMNYPYNINYLAYFSSRGPTLDGRIKPDLVGPGFSVTSASASGTTSQTCNLEVLAGTSMATPTISSSALLVREYFMKGYYPSGAANPNDSYTPSAALVKAVLINGAVGLTGVLNSDGTVTKFGSPPDYYQGFGRVNLDNSLPFKDSSMIALDYKSVSQGDVFQFNVTVLSSSKSLVFTLVWTDPASTSSASSNLVNDLDLLITSVNSSVVYYPNGLSKEDRVNNVEKISISSPTVGEVFIVSITGYSVQNSQNFALVGTGIFNTTENGTLEYSGGSTGSSGATVHLNLSMLWLILALCLGLTFFHSV